MNYSSGIRCCVVFFFLLFFSRSYSQQVQANDYADISFWIKHIDQEKDDSVFATMGGGSRQGILANTSALVYGSIKNKIKGRDNLELGYALITRVFEDSSSVIIIRYDKTNPITKVYANDYITVSSIKLPPYTYHALFFELIKNNIHFILYNQETYDLNTLLYNDSKILEDSIVSLYIKGLQELYEMLKDKKEGYESIFEPMKEGRYKGLSLMDVMHNAKASDIHPFLKYVNSYNISYTSQEWYFPEIFATWVLSNAPYCKQELQDSLDYFKNDISERKRIINTNASRILSERMVYYWAQASINMINDRKFDAALKILNTAIEVGTTLNDTNGLAYAYLFKAETYQNMEDYKEAIKYCDKSAYYFALYKNNPGVFKAKMKSAYCLYAQKKYSEAIPVLKKLITEFDAHRNEFEDYEKVFNEQKIYNFLAYSYYELFDFNNALENFRKTIEINNSSNTLENKKRNILFYDMVATIYKKQGLDKEALAAYTSLLESYQNLGNPEKVAATYNNIAYLEFNLGNLQGSIWNYNQAFDIYLGLKLFSDAGFSKSGAAQAYYRLGKYDTAIVLHKLAISYRSISNDYAGIAYSWNKLGSLYIQTGEKINALAALDSALNYYILDKDSSSLYSVYISFGDLYIKEKNNLKAFEKYYKAYEISEHSKNTVNIIECAFKIGDATYSYDTMSSRKYFTICNKLAQSMGDESNQIYSLLNLGNLASMNYQFTDSRNKIDRALAIATKNGNVRDKAVCYKFMANVYSNELNIDKADDYYLKALHIFDSIGEVTQLTNLNLSLGFNRITKGDFINAENYYLEALRVAEKNENIPDKADAMIMMTTLYSMIGDFSKAFRIIDSSIAMVNTMQNVTYLANAYLSKGNIYQHTSDYKQANYYYLKADSIYHKENNLISWSISQNNIGTLYYWQADYDGSYPYINNAYSILEKINLKNESWILYAVNLGEIFQAKKDYPSAFRYLLPANKIAKEKKLNRMIAASSMVLGKVEFERANYTQALAYFKEANEYGEISKESENIIESSLYLGRCYLKLNNKEKGNEYLRKCVAVSARFNIVKYNWEALYDLGMTYFSVQHYDSAIIYFKQAIGIVEESSNKVFEDEKVKNKYANDVRKVDLYTKIISSFVELKNTDEALEYANKSNIQGLKDKISQGGIMINDEKKSEAIKKAQQLDLQLKTVKDNLSKEKAKPVSEQNQEIVNSYERTILNVEANYKNYIDSLAVIYPNIIEYSAKHANPGEFKTYKKNIPKDVAVVLYIINEENLFIFTVTNETKKVSIVKIKQADLEKKIKTFISLLNIPDKSAGAHTLKLRGSTLLEEPKDVGGATLLGTSKDLYRILIEPIADELKGKNKLCIIPNGKLCNIPFQVLGSVDKNGAYQFLVEQFSIFYISKLDVFLKSSTGNDSLSSIAAFGNPDFQNTQVSLPSAEKEVRDIQDILKSGDYFYGKAATEEQAKKSLETKHFIHFATHGILDNSNFKNSYIKFSSDAGDDGNLSINEINGLELAECDMVVLSACETAITNDSIKGWYYSAANSFIESGAKTVIASLWSVDDNATSILMTEFYKNLKTMPKADALRQAQAYLSKNPLYVHPFFWGAFVLYGDWR